MTSGNCIRIMTRNIFVEILSQSVQEPPTIVIFGGMNYLLVFELVPFQSSNDLFSALFSSIQIKSGTCEANGINHSNDNSISGAGISTIHCDELTGGAGTQTNHHSNANGSLITMTMKNNHLIVETEERSVS